MTNSDTGLLPSNAIGAKRYKLTVGHSDDAGLGSEGWYVRMSDHFPSFDTAQKWIREEDYEALRGLLSKWVTYMDLSGAQSVSGDLRDNPALSLLKDSREALK